MMGVLDSERALAQQTVVMDPEVALAVSANDERTPAVRYAADGNSALVIWAGGRNGDSQEGVQGMRVNAQGQALGAAQRLDRVAGGGAASVRRVTLAKSPAGGWWAAWVETVGTHRLFLRRIGADGAPQGNAIRVDQNDASSVRIDYAPGLAVDGLGRPWVAWSQTPVAGGGVDAVQLRRFSSAGAPLEDARRVGNEAEQTLLQDIALEQGAAAGQERAVLAYRWFSNTRLQALDQNAQALGAAVNTGQQDSNAGAATLSMHRQPDGTARVRCHWAFNGDISGAMLTLQQSLGLDAPLVAANEVVTGTQNFPALAVQGGFRALIGFVDQGSNRGTSVADRDVYARRFNDLNQPRTGDFRLNSTLAGIQSDLSMDIDGAGNVMAAWASTQPGNNALFDVYARRIQAPPVTDLQLSASQSPSNPSLGGQVVQFGYRISVPADVSEPSASSLVVTLPQPVGNFSNISWVAPAGWNCSVGGASARCDQAAGTALMPGFSADFALRMTPSNTPAQYTVIAEARPGGQADERNPGDNRLSQTLNVAQSFTNLSLKSTSATPTVKLPINGIATLRLDYANATAASVVASPAQTLTVLSGGGAGTPPTWTGVDAASAADWSCTSSTPGRADACTRNQSLSVGASGTVRARFQGGTSTGRFPYQAKLSNSDSTISERDPNDQTVNLNVDVCDPGQIRFAQASYRESEKDSDGASNRGAQILVERSSDGCSIDLNARWELIPGTAAAGSDYGPPVRGVVSFDAGQTGLTAISFPIIDDNDAEPVETLTIRLYDPSSGTTPEQTATIEIVSDEAADPNAISIESTIPQGTPRTPARILENAGQSYTITAVRAAAGAKATVKIVTAGTSTSGSDWSLATRAGVSSKTLTIAAGQLRSAPLYLVINDDAQNEPDEGLRLRAGTVTGGTLQGTFDRSLLIIDNDPP